VSIYQQFGVAVPARQNEDAIYRDAKLPRCRMADTLESGASMEDYVERREGGYYIAGTRISLDSIVHPFKNGASPEGLLRSFPLIGSLEKVDGAITFYLANREAIEAYLSDQKRLSEELAAKQPPLPESLSKKLNRAREEALPR
jgi:uncharacterized protein (DUF433 family)